MRSTAALLAGLIAAGCSTPSPRVAPALTLDDVLASRAVTGSPPTAPMWDPTGRHLAFLWRGPDGGPRRLWLHGEGARCRPLTDDPVGSARWLRDGSGLTYTSGGEVRVVRLDGAASVEATRLPRGASDVAWSPNGAWISFRKDGDLWLAARADGSTRRLTELGEPPSSAVPAGRYRRNEVEVGAYVWGGPTYAWSPDSETLAVHVVDRTDVRRVPFPNYLGDETDPNYVRRGYPGDPNESRRVGLLDVASGALRMLSLPAPTATRIAGMAWSKRGSLLIDCESDTAVERTLYVLAPGAARPRLLWRHRRESRVYTTCGSAWHPDGEHVIVLSDLGDRYGLYALHLDDPTPRLLTDPAADVLGGLRVTDDGVIFYETNATSPRDRHVCSTTLDGEPTQWTRRGGESRGYPSPDGRRLALVHSSDLQPPELFLQPSPGAAARRLTTSTPEAFVDRGWCRPRYVSFPSPVDGAEVHARIFEPEGLDRGRRHPVIFGPVYSNTVRDRWGGRYGLLQQLLVARGYIVVQVDVRGSTGYGRAFREQFLGDFAGRDLQDLAGAVDYVEQLPYVDPDAIGIWGSSYGGTLTVYALLKEPGLFDAGVACAAAVDPRFFGGDDVAIVRRPDSLPAAFTRGAAQYAANLEDPLLLIHGMQDQVVPFKTAVDLAEALMRADKDFDFAFAPLATHGWTSRPHYARYLLGKLLAHFDRHLRGR